MADQDQVCSYTSEISIRSIPAVPRSELPDIRFLSLPIEIRLEVYSRCPIFSLLQLSHTSSQLHQEINDYPSIFRSAFGINPSQELKEARTLSVNLVQRLYDQSEVLLYNKLVRGCFIKVFLRGLTEAPHVCGKCRCLKRWNEFVIGALRAGEVQAKHGGSFISESCKECSKDDAFVVVCGYGRGSRMSWK
ncbi:hypothetical protein BJ508DRAFT_302194 [Ascobolus immersus RN42]|uniref:F-box domain-containing protein n=1 Tax=Ascobolus immersus RN42 TaxID=1160509 RepID=A0A3N4IXC0_ASCIM|nr:hypothetical protein BJ508DRAFT_302194 [Ascobolus immersus RN42]